MTPEATSAAVSRSAFGIFNSTSGWLRKKPLTTTRFAIRSKGAIVTGSPLISAYTRSVPDSLIADDARQRRSDRICTLDEIHVVQVDRCMLDTDQHLVGARCRRFRKVGKLERREVRPARPVSWVLRFTPDRSYTLRFDGARWSRQRGEAQADRHPDVARGMGALPERGPGRARALAGPLARHRDVEERQGICFRVRPPYRRVTESRI